MKKINYSQFIEELYLEAKRAKWKMFYDKESDTLFWTKRPTPSGDKLAKVAKEIAFYLNRNGKVNGLIIQPFQNNFLSHNEAVSGIKKLLTNKEEGGMFTIPSEKRKDAEHLLPTLSETIKKDIYKDAMEARYSSKDIARFLHSSTR